jgi:putative 2OG-Fe(II) oxygenase
MMNARATIDALARDGYARLGNPFSSEQIQLMQAEVDRVYAQPREPFSKLQQEKKAGRYGLKVLVNSDWSVALDVAGFSPKLDALLEHAMSDPAVKEVLGGVLGQHYKLEQVNVRRAEPGGNGQHLHQDAVGEMGMTILVRDLPELGGATAFLPGSHRWPVRYSDVGITFDPWWLKPLLGAAMGNAGDVFFFFNRTWHGRFGNQRQADAIMMSFFGVGAQCRARPVPQETLETFGPELRKVIDPTRGFEPAGDGRSTVVGPNGELSVPRVPPFDQVLAGHIPVPLIGPWLPARAWGAMTRTVRKVASVRHRLRANGG